MKTLLKNDLLYLRRSLVFWGAILLFVVLLFASLRTPLGWNVDYWTFLQWALIVGMILQVVTQLLLMATLIQKERLQDPQAYWLTRPIPRGQLALAKITFLLGFVVLPQVLQFALAGAFFPGGWEGVWRGMQIGAVFGIICGLLGTVSASLTKDAGQAVLATIGIPVVLFIVLSVVWRCLSVATGGYLEFLEYSRVAQVFLFLTGTVWGLWAFWWQYRKSLLRWRHRLHFAGALALLFAGLQIAPVAPVPASTMKVPAEAELTVDNFVFSRVDSRFPGFRSTEGGSSLKNWREGGLASSYQLRGSAEWRGLPEDWIASVQALHSYEPNGELLPVIDDGLISSRSDSVPSGYHTAVFPEAQMDSIPDRDPQRQALFTTGKLDPHELKLPATFTTVFESRFYQGKKSLIPSKVTDRIQLGKTRLLLESAEPTEDGWSLEFRFLGTDTQAGELGDTIEGGLLALKDPDSNRVAFGRGFSTRTFTVGELFISGTVGLEFEGLPPTELDQLELYHVEPELIGISVDQVEYSVSGE